jgi:hypothetical protein
MYNNAFWKTPNFQHWRVMLERGRQFASPGTMSAASGEVLTTSVLARMIRWWRFTHGIRKGDAVVKL